MSSMHGHASWWDNPGATNNDTPVIRHAPDDDQYHLANDGDQLRKMRGSLVGKFALIPAANNDGTSKGFDPTIAGPVHVDPDAPDGGVVFDPNSVHGSQVHQAVATSNYPHEAFYKLGTPAHMLGIGKKGYGRQVQQEAPRVNPLMPGSYVVPKAADNGVQTIPLVPQEQTVTPALPLGPLPVAQPQPPQQMAQPMAQPFAPQPFAPPAMDPTMVAMMQAMQQQMQAMQQQLAQQQLAQQAQAQQPTPHFVTGMSATPLPKGIPGLATMPAEMQQNGRRQAHTADFEDTARPIRQQVKRNKETQDIEAVEEPKRPRSNSMVEQEEAPQTVRQYREAYSEGAESVIAGFETLNLPWVNGPIAGKAKKQVFFELPGAGKHLARYHDVIDSEHCVALVYDTRYEEGTQYLPPNLNTTPIRVTVQGMKKGFTVASMGFQFAMGVFDVVVLVKVPSAEGEETEDAG